MGTVSLQRSSRDVRFTIPARLGGGTLSCMLARGTRKDGRVFKIRRMAVPAEEGQQQRLRETAVTYADWQRGAGIGKASDDTRGGYNYGTFLYARSRGMLMPAGEMTEITLPAGDVTALNSAFDLGGYTYLTCGNRNMLRVTNAGTSLTAATATTFAAGAVTQSSAVFKDKAWIANAGSYRIYSFDGTTWAQASTDVRRSRLAVTNWVMGASTAITASQIGTSQRVLVGTDASNPQVYHVTDDPGDTADWSAANAVGDSVYPIQSLHAAGEAVFAGKPDGVFMIEGGGRMRNLAPHWRNQYDASNGASVQFYDEFLLCAHTQYLDMVSPNPERIGLQTPCHPGAGQSFENSPIFGRCTFQIVDSGYVLASFYNGANSYIMAGRRSDRLGLSSANPITWYGAEAVVPGYVTLLHLLPAVSPGPRWLLIGALESGTARLYAQSMPVELTPYTAWKRGGGHRFASSFTCVQSLDDLGDPNSPKNMRYVAVVTENAENTRALTVSTSTDGGASTEQVEIIEAGRQFAIMDSATAAGVNIEVTLTGTSEPTEPLVIRSVKLRGTINDERTVVYEVPLEFGRDLPTNRMTTDPASPWVKRAQLMALIEAGPISVQDWNGITRTMVLEDVVEEETLDDDGNGVSVQAVVTLSVLLSQAVYGSAVYASDRYG